MAINQWDPTSLPIRPGLYVNFRETAVAQISGGSRGTVAIPLLSSTGGTAKAKEFHTVANESEAVALFGSANIASIKLILGAGAKEVLVYTMPASPTADDYTQMRESFEAYSFNVFVFDGEVPADQLTATKTWVVQNRNEKKHFFFVAGGKAAEDADITKGNARSVALDDDYIVNLVVGGTFDGKQYSSGQYAAYIAGLIAGTPLNRSITYTKVAMDDVNKRLRNSEVETALQAGSLVLINDDDRVIVEQGLTTSKAKIRKIRTRQAVATDVEKTARKSYIGKLDNNPDGQAALMSAIKVYLETLEASNVLTDIVVMLDPQNKSIGENVFLLISYTEIDSMERILLSINV